MRGHGAPLAALALLLLAGCGSADHNPPAAEPAVSPPLSARPAGELLRLGGEAEGVAIDLGAFEEGGELAGGDL